MWRLAAMENTLFGNPALDWEDRCALIAECGYRAVYAVPYPLDKREFNRLDKLSAVARRRGLDLVGAYANIDLALPVNSVGFKASLQFFETVDAPRIELSFKQSVSVHSRANLEDEILRRLEHVLLAAETRRFPIALYPHSFYPLDSIAQAEGIVRRAGHPRLSLVFPTSHLYALNSPDVVNAQLAACAARIVSFNISGCRRASPIPPGKCTHLPLDEGDLELNPLLTTLAQNHYSGDVIIQGHGWTGDLPDLLRRSRRFFEKITTTLSRARS